MRTIMSSLPRRRPKPRDSTNVPGGAYLHSIGANGFVLAVYVTPPEGFNVWRRQAQSGGRS
jgi:hypothetical protein